MKYLVAQTLHVCKQIGCAKQATYTLFEDKLMLGEYCYFHGALLLEPDDEDSK
jgi:hypothetical protein